MRFLILVFTVACGAALYAAMPSSATKPAQVITKEDAARAKAHVQRLVDAGVFARVRLGGTPEVVADRPFFLADHKGKLGMLAPVLTLARAEKVGEFITVRDAFTNKAVGHVDGAGYWQYK